MTSLPIHSSPPDLTVFDGDGLPPRGLVDDLFRSLAPTYERALLTFSFGQDLRWKHELLARAGVPPPARVLDLACGTGLLSERLVQRFGDGSVVGLDRSGAMLRVGLAERPSHRVARGDAVRLPFRDGSFDLVTAAYLFKYVRLDDLFREVRRVLRPGGRVAGYDFSRPIETSASGRLYSIFLGTVLPRLGRGRPDGDYTSRRLLEFLDQLARGSGWERRIASVLERSGFRDVTTVPSLGGAITWVWARA